MASMFCPDCSVSLDDVPVGNPCPGCGGRRRSAKVGIPAVSATISVGEVRALVQEAVDELTAMPTDRARVVGQQLVELGRADGTGTATGVDIVTASAPNSVSAVDGARVYDEAIVEVLHLADSYDAVVAHATSAIQRALANPDARAVLLNIVANGLYDLLKYGPLAYLTYTVATGQPPVQINLHYHAAPAPALVEPAPKQPPLPGDVCLPSDEPATK
jgi:hypothetical protein